MFERRLHLSQPGSQADEDAQALRWRTAILKLSENFMEAADVRQDLSLVLMEALHNALENLLLLGDETDLIALEEWLDLETACDGSAPALNRVETVVPTALADSYSAGDEQRQA